MKWQILILIMLAVFSSCVYALDFRTMYNPFTSKLDYYSLYNENDSLIVKNITFREIIFGLNYSHIHSIPNTTGLSEALTNRVNRSEIAGFANTSQIKDYGWTTTATTVYNNTAGLAVGIGTDSPTEKLMVMGNINATGWINSSGYFMGSINLFDEINKKSNITDVNSALGLKMNITDFNTNLTATNNRFALYMPNTNWTNENKTIGDRFALYATLVLLGQKANITDMFTELGKKSNLTDVASDLGKKTNLTASQSDNATIATNLTGVNARLNTLFADNQTIGNTAAFLYKANIFTALWNYFFNGNFTQINATDIFIGGINWTQRTISDNDTQGTKISNEVSLQSANNATQKTVIDAEVTLQAANNATQKSAIDAEVTLQAANNATQENARATLETKVNANNATLTGAFGLKLNQTNPIISSNITFMPIAASGNNTGIIIYDSSGVCVSKVNRWNGTHIVDGPC